MAVYDFKCSSCGKVFELTRKMTEVKSIEECPECGSESYRSYLATPTVFKCDGFYTTDNRRSE